MDVSSAPGEGSGRYLRTEFTVESEVLAQRVVDAARVGSTVYMAIECGDRSTAGGTRWRRLCSLPLVVMGSPTKT